MYSACVLLCYVYFYMVVVIIEAMTSIGLATIHLMTAILV